MKAIINKTEQIHGCIEISGSKNATLPLIACALLTKERVVIKNVPIIKDIDTMVQILKKMKVHVLQIKHDLIIQRKHTHCNLLIEDIKKIRGSSYLIGALFALKKRVKSYFPGGCNLGERPIDYHLLGFQKLGATVKVNQDKIIIKRKKITGSTIEFPSVSVGATINIIIASVLGTSKTVIVNPSLEPEVLETIEFLKSMGAKIKIINQQVTIEGVKKLYSTCYKTMFDRIEAGSYLLLGASFPNTKMTITNVNFKYLENIITVLEQIGVNVKKDTYKITIKTGDKINPINVSTDIYPGFPTDLQQILTVTLLNALGTSQIIDTIFPSRISHVEELKKLGADIKIVDEKIVVNNSKLIGAPILGIDLRGTFALIVASGMADGMTEIKNIDHVFRGYENLEYKLKKLNFKIEFIDE